MRILFDDIIENADTITSATPSALYPAENLKHPFIARRYQGFGNADIVTIPFSSDQSLNCFFYQLQNFSSFSVVLKDSGGSTLQTINVSSISDPGREYFTTVSGVRSIELNIATTDPKVRLGIFRAGIYYQTRDFLNVFPLGLVDNSLYEKSDVGYSSNNHVTPLKAFEFTFRENTKSEADEINQKYLSNGKKPVFFDFTHDNNNYLEPLYANILNPPNPQKTNRRFAYELQIEEAK